MKVTMFIILAVFLVSCSDMPLESNEPQILCGTYIVKDHCLADIKTQWIEQQCLICVKVLDYPYQPINFTDVCIEHLNESERDK